MELMTLLTIAGAVAAFAGNAYGAFQKVRAARFEEAALRKDRAISSLVAAIEVWGSQPEHAARAKELKKTVQLFALGNSVETEEIAPSVLDITSILEEVFASSASQADVMKRAIKAVQEYESPDKRGSASGLGVGAPLAVFYFAFAATMLTSCTTPAGELSEVRLTHETVTTGSQGEYIVIEWPATVTDPERVKSFSEDGRVLSVAPLGTN